MYQNFKLSPLIWVFTIIGALAMAVGTLCIKWLISTEKKCSRIESQTIIQPNMEFHETEGVVDTIYIYEIYEN